MEREREREREESFLLACLDDDNDHNDEVYNQSSVLIINIVLWYFTTFLVVVGKFLFRLKEVLQSFSSQPSELVLRKISNKSKTARFQIIFLFCWLANT